MAIVYKITNKTNNKSYVGFTTRTIEQRWKSHISASRQNSPYRFHSAIRKYGIDDWNLEIIFENVDVNLCRLKEELIIKELDLINNKKGYNAKPGGCGGWIVPEEKYDQWLKKLSDNNIGMKNGNCSGYTNDELIEIGKMICLELGRIVGHTTLLRECKKRNISFPKSFTKFRFGGTYKNFWKILEKELNMKYDPYFNQRNRRNLNVKN